MRILKAIWTLAARRIMGWCEACGNREVDLPMGLWYYCTECGFEEYFDRVKVLTFDPISGIFRTHEH